MSYDVINLFAGPGGREEGLKLVGVTSVLGIENDEITCETGEAAGHPRLCADVTALNPVDHGGHNLVGLTASPVCRGFTNAGKGEGRKDVPLLLRAVAEMASGRDVRDDLGSQVADERSLLALEPLRWVLDLEPEWTAWEQVPAVLPLWEACGEALRADGYSVATGVINSEQYGVPQTRRRAVLLASRQGEVRLPVPTHSRFHSRTPERLDPGIRKWVSMAEALDLDGNGFLRSNYSHGGDLTRRGERSIHHPAFSVTGKFDRNIWVYRGSNQAHAAKRRLDQPAPTVLFSARANKVEWIPHDIANDPSASGVRVSIEEAAILQSFRGDYPFQGTKSQQYQQCGDAVPPLMDAHCYQALGVGRLTTERAA